MPVELTRLRIEGLHHRYTIDIPIRENKLVLVGENGLGKSTVVNLLFFFLTCQWHRLAKYSFESIAAVIDEQEIAVNRESFVDLVKSPEHFEVRVDNVSFEDLFQIRPEQITAQIVGDVRRFAEARRLGKREIPQELGETEQTLKPIVTDQVLYLPTYRRIEQELSAIFPGVDQERFARRRKRSRTEHMELVEFGMQDVEETIQHKMDALKENIRTGLSKLAGSYLGDVIRGDYRGADPALLRQLDDTTVDAIFSRIDTSILPEGEQASLKDSLNQIRAGTSEENKVVTHFLTRLLQLHKTQQAAERDVEEFVRVCNTYLLGKRFVYDKLNFDIAIHLDDESTNGIEQEEENSTLPLRLLSSGEKQIVSLFSHIYLSGGASYFVIIDEPELSLSVPWQRQFLPDILKTGRCNGLVAVTHSPFVFDNELDAYAHSLEEFTGAFRVVA